MFATGSVHRALAHGAHHTTTCPSDRTSHRLRAHPSMHYAPLQPGPLVHTTACLEYAQPQPARPAHHTDIFSTRRLEGCREYFRVTEEKEAQRAREHSRRAHNGKQTTRPSHPRTSPAANSTLHVWPIAHATHPNAQVRCARNENTKTGEASGAARSEAVAELQGARHYGARPGAGRTLGRRHARDSVCMREHARRQTRARPTSVDQRHCRRRKPVQCSTRTRRMCVPACEGVDTRTAQTHLYCV